MTPMPSRIASLQARKLMNREIASLMPQADQPGFATLMTDAASKT